MTRIKTFFSIIDMKSQIVIKNRNEIKSLTARIFCSTEACIQDYEKQDLNFTKVHLKHS